MRRVSLCHHFIRGTHFPLFIPVLLTHLPRDRLENNPINTVKTLIAAIQKQSDQLLIAFWEPQTVNTKPIRMWKMGALNLRPILLFEEIRTLICPQFYCGTKLSLYTNLAVIQIIFHLFARRNRV
jgi:hypothetical protein